MKVDEIIQAYDASEENLIKRIESKIKKEIGFARVWFGNLIKRIESLLVLFLIILLHNIESHKEN